MRRRAERPSPFAMGMAVHLGCFSREECPNPELFDALNQKIAEWEREEERRKDPVGAIVKRMNGESGEVFFSDCSRTPMQPRVRLSYRREAMKRLETDAAPSLAENFRASSMEARIVMDPAVNLADTYTVSRTMLYDPEWDYEDEICADLRRLAERLATTPAIPGRGGAERKR